MFVYVMTQFALQFVCLLFLNPRIKRHGPRPHDGAGISYLLNVSGFAGQRARVVGSVLLPALEDVGKGFNPPLLVPA